jgi:hypothetical protein
LAPGCAGRERIVGELEAEAKLRGEAVHAGRQDAPHFFVHCFDRIVIQGYLPLLTRPEHIVHFFRDVHGI